MIHPFWLEENLGGADLQQLEKALAEISIHGNRYPERLEKMTGL